MITNINIISSTTTATTTDNNLIIGGADPAWALVRGAEPVRGQRPRGAPLRGNI